MAIADEIAANCAHKTCHGEDYPPKNCAYNTDGEPPHTTPTSVQRRACTTRAVDPCGPPVIRPLGPVLCSDTAPSGSYDRFCRNLCATPGTPHGSPGRATHAIV